MSTKYNFRRVENQKLIPVKDNFLGCEFRIMHIAVNIPDRFATSWEEVQTNQFLFVCSLFKNGNWIEDNCHILVTTNKKHTLHDYIRTILQDIKEQQITLFSIGKDYYLKGNNYKLVA